MKEITNFEDITASSIEKFNEFFHFMLSHGIYLPPSGYETWFISDAISSSHIDKTLTAIRKFK